MSYNYKFANSLKPDMNNPGKKVARRRLLSVVILISLTLSIYGFKNGNTFPDLSKKSVTALRTGTAPKIDGVIDEAVWSNCPVATDFIGYNPYNGIASKNRTEVRLLYDDNSLYIAAIMYDACPDSIFTELGPRDSQDINADFFYVELSPFNDGLNGEMFKVFASNVQADLKLQEGGDDYHREDTWDAVWESRTRIIDEGWSAEIRIPYSA